ncbi:hypothetical protein H9L39_18970 [Fusarium oxysporum f. sp. albedinis]|nr:hypothetical protein H9L39_18970 [Fusarium oxysporum f. sp. albedinis]
MEAAALAVGNMQYSDWCDKQAAIFSMVAVIPLVASDEAGNHSPPATDLPLGLIVFAIYILALTCYVMCVSRRRNISGNIY